MRKSLQPRSRRLPPTVLLPLLGHAGTLSTRRGPDSIRSTEDCVNSSASLETNLIGDATRGSADSSKETKLLRQRLALWDSMELLIERHIDPDELPLLLDRPENESDPILSMVYYALHQLANPNPQTDSAIEHGCFADIPMPIQTFETLMLAAYRLLSLWGRAQNTRFLDVGCGGGTKVFAASRFFQFCDGLEYDPRYAETGQQTLNTIGAENCRVLQGDALTFKHYGDYDVIYFYRPMRDDKVLEQMENHIFSSARPGTVILAPYDAFCRPRSGIAHPNVDGPVFVTGLTQAESNDLRSEVERTGPEIVKRSLSFPFDTGFWAPILEAAQFNGLRK